MPTISKSEAIKMGVPQNTLLLHTILVPRSFTKKTAVNWLKSHNYRHDRYRITKNFMRFNQIWAVLGANYFTKKLPNGIELVFMKF